ncbi:MAG: glycosyltransferase family 4 protein [Rhodospirillaceae bacterium]|nr:glycosyltransferase family 4 protein [Rhodospirillaceae bacterium]
MAWYRYHSRVTGIQRVAERLLTTAPVLDSADIAFVARVEGLAGYVDIDRSWIAALGAPQSREDAIGKFRTLAARLAPEPHRRPAVLRLLRPRAARDAGGIEPAALGHGDVLVNLADFWTHRDQAAAFARIHAAGCRLIQFIYDIIPETHPHVCHETSIEPFRQALAGIVANASGYCVSSRHVRGEFEAHLARVGAPARPIAMVPFGWEFGAAPAAEPGAGAAQVLARYGLAEGGYILQVGTLEPRKNHMLVVRTLHRLYSRFGGRLPTLVFVGREGWRTEPLLNELMSIDYLGGRIRILSEVADADLAALYRGCRFTVFASYVEGWGLPVQESLAFGAPCLASHAASIPEAGLDLAEYFDPYDTEAFAAALERWIGDDAHIAAQRARIAGALATRALPRWSDGARAVLNLARQNVAVG